MLRLRPYVIHYSQDSINNTFDASCNHSGVLIGQTVDDIMKGRTNISSIPRITVVKRNGKWVTANNRRLWVFMQLERLGKCTYIDVHEGLSIPTEKLTSTNDGITVRVRGPPGSYWLKRVASVLGGFEAFRFISYDADRTGPNSSKSSRITSSYPSRPARVQPTQDAYQESSYTTYDRFYSISSSWHNRAYQEPRENDSWCGKVLPILLIMLILLILWNVII